MIVIVIESFKLFLYG